MAGKPIHDDEVLEAIDQHWLDKLYPPSSQYLVENSELSSKSTVAGALRRLEKQDKIILLFTLNGYKAYTNWAYWALFHRAREIENEREEIQGTSEDAPSQV